MTHSMWVLGLLGLHPIEARTAQPLLPPWLLASRARAGVYLILACLAAVFFATAGICTRLAPAIGARAPIAIGAALAPAGMFWLSRVHEHSQYLTGVCLPLMVFAAAAGLIFVPLTAILVAGISDGHAGVASSMFNVGQQVGGAVGLAVIGTVAWTAVSSRSRPSPAAPGGSPGYDHALASGVTQALTIGAAATVLALLIAMGTILARRPAGAVSAGTSR